MSKISNVLLMLQYLENGRKYSIKELAEKLEVSERMVRFYKEELEKAGVYIDTMMGPYGGYILNKKIDIPDCLFTEDDFKFLNELKVEAEKEDELKTIANKIQTMYIKYPREKLSIPDELRKNFNLLNRAIRDKKRVKILYNSTSSGERYRIIRPYNISSYENIWSCAAYCEIHESLRHFNISKILEVEILKD